MQAPTRRDNFEATTAATMTREGTGTMRAVVQRAYGSTETLQLDEIARPVVAAKQVLVEVHAAGVNRVERVDGWRSLWFACISAIRARPSDRAVPRACWRSSRGCSRATNAYHSSHRAASASTLGAASAARAAIVDAISVAAPPRRT